jgi:6-phospho-beta-glucosidase
MKLLLLGAGVRTPLLLHGLIRRQQTLGLTEVRLYDNDPARLTTMGAFARYLAERQGASFRVEVFEDFRAAATGAGFVFSAIRVGQEQQRVLDERIPLKYGVLGQETTGPGGFAMALRTIPVVLDYARVLHEVAPDAWFVNFTNPAGLITQALLTHSPLRRVIGICDTPTAMLTSLAAFLQQPPEAIYADYFGLNHLGWIRRVLIGGRDMVPELLDRYEELAATDQEWALFDPALVRMLGMLPNEYLYYYYYREQAVQNILAAQTTRGEQLREINTPLWHALSQCLDDDRPDEALQLYEAQMMERNASYMARESGHAKAEPPKDTSIFAGEGYAGLAMAVMEAVVQAQQRTLILNVRNNGCLRELGDDDVVEAVCVVDQHGAVPIAQPPMPQVAAPLVQSVKAYERLTITAAVTGSYDAALAALTIHPLVMSYPVGKKILDDYLHAGNCELSVGRVG